MRIKGSQGKLLRTKKEGFTEMVASIASILKGALLKGHTQGATSLLLRSQGKAKIEWNHQQTLNLQ